METKTKQMPSLEDRIRAILCYYGHPLTLQSAATLQNVSLTIHRMGHAEEFDMWDKICLELKPLSKINDKDAEECMIYFFSPKPEDAKWYPTPKTFVNGLFTDYKIGTHLNEARAVQKAIDFLREKGYALPYKNWSVEELVEFGIYKLID